MTKSIWVFTQPDAKTDIQAGLEFTHRRAAVLQGEHQGVDTLFGPMYRVTTCV